jgi:phosphatidylglycerophosphatase A
MRPPADLRLLRSPSGLLASGLGSGLSPVAPGTAGSALGLLLFWPLQELSLTLQIVATVLLFLVAVPASTAVARRVGMEDPGVVVIDEVVGMWVTLLGMPFTPAVAAVGFLLFRAMDVIKPYPARDLESLPGGWGIMWDDVVAGIYAQLLLRALLLAWPGP